MFRGYLDIAAPTFDMHRGGTLRGERIIPTICTLIVRLFVGITRLADLGMRLLALKISRDNAGVGQCHPRRGRAMPPFLNRLS